MKKTTIIITILMAGFILSSCTTNKESGKRNNSICSIEFHEKENKLFLGEFLIDNVDPKTFQNLGADFIKDNTSVYLLDLEKKLGEYDCTGIIKVNSVKKVAIVKDPASFDFIDGPAILPSYAKDNYLVYKINVHEAGHLEIVDGAESKTFQSVEKNKKTTEYYKDNNYIYYRGKRVVGADVESFKVIAYQIGQDKNKTYLRGQPVNEASSDMQILYKSGKGIIGKDNNHVYDLSKNEIIENIDAKTFEYFTDYRNTIYSKDKNNVFCCYGKPNAISSADVETFEILKNDKNRGYAIDKNNVYFRGKTIEGADIDTFERYNPPGMSTSQARDKNYLYDGGKIVEKRQ